jgi:two-component system invasion response regulator UvrY
MISDPSSFAREGIKQMLAKREAFDIVFESDNAADTLRGLQQIKPQVCILDVAIAGRSGLSFIREVRSHAFHIPLIVMSHCHERDFALRAIRAGAAGYLPKDCTDEQLALALEAAAARRPYVSDTICELIVESIVEGRPKRPHDKLSDTDFEILCLLADGIPLSRIADICKLSVGTVRTRRSRIMEQMCLRGDVELVEYAISRKLIGHDCPAL